MLGGVFAPRFTFMGRQVWLQKNRRSSRESLKSQNRHIVGAGNGCRVSVFGVIRLV